VDHDATLYVYPNETTGIRGAIWFCGSRYIHDGVRLRTILLPRQECIAEAFLQEAPAAHLSHLLYIRHLREFAALPRQPLAVLVSL